MVKIYNLLDMKKIALLIIIKALIKFQKIKIEQLLEVILLKIILMNGKKVLI